MEKEKILKLLGEGLPIPKVAKLLKTNRIKVWREAQRLERAGKLIRVSKKPATYLSMLPTDAMLQDSMLGRSLVTGQHRNLIHSTHRLKFSIGYKGKQPTIGATVVRPFGRYKTARQAVFKLGRITIIAFKRRLNVWVHDPPGKLTQHQIINARRDAYLSLMAFTKEHRIKLEGDLSQVLRSEHVVEHPTVNKGLKPVFEAYGDKIEERIGSNLCPSSHKGKIEHRGVSKEITGARVAKNAEYLFTLFPEHFSALAQANVDFRENMLTHLEVMRKIGKSLDLLQKKLQP